MLMGLAICKCLVTNQLRWDFSNWKPTESRWVTV